VFVGLCAALDSDAAQRSFADFRATYNRQYATAADEAKRFACFTETLKKIEDLNARDTALHAVNRFADLCADEFKAMYHNLQSNKTGVPGPSVGFKAPLDSFDWRTQGAVAPIKDQQQCGSCWAFSAVDTMEGAWKLAGHTLTTLSEEELVQCGTTAGYGCQGGWMDKAVLWVVSNGGINSETAYPYTSGTGITGTCDSAKAKVSVAKFSGVITGPTVETQLSAFLTKNGPLSIAVDATDGWQTYHSGIKSACSGRNLDHGVGIVGFGDNYWIIRNSWGQSWGEAGYIRVAQGQNCDGMMTDVIAAKV